MQERLRVLRTVIREAAPLAVERMSYGMPTWWHGENLVHIAACARHVGFYPTPSGIEAFLGEIDGVWKWSKGAVQFPLDQELPLDLVRRITAWRYGIGIGMLDG